MKLPRLFYCVKNKGKDMNWYCGDLKWGLRGEQDNEDLLQFIALLCRPTVCSLLPQNLISEAFTFYCVSHVLLGRGIWAELQILKTLQRKTSYLRQGKSQASGLRQTITWPKLSKLSFAAPFSSIWLAVGFFTTWALCVEKQLVNYSTLRCAR